MPVGYISGQSGMQIKFQNLPDSTYITATSVDQDIVSATGVGGVLYKDYAFYTYTTEADAVTYGWPTGNGSHKFGHSGQIANHG